jgi:acyl-[acyl-carrier-protein]-phospholipid O-acyltransferase/long-chain-fatty-acid--[acyl-carrier-protein] ligase
MKLREDEKVEWAALATCWFWAVGVVVSTVLPPLVKTTLGGDEIAVTVSLAIFSVGIAAGCAVVAWFVAGRTIVFPTVVAALLFGVFAIELGWATSGPASATTAQAAVEIFTSLKGIHVALSLAGLAMAGGVFIVPVMASIQAWAGADRRARVMAGVNVLTAAAMTAAALVTSALQALGLQPPALFMLLGVVSIAVAFGIGATIPTRSSSPLGRS